MDTMAPRQTDSDRRAAELLAHTQQTCDPVLREAVGWLPEPLHAMIGYHFGWWDRDGRPGAFRAGKSLRAALTLCSAQACGAQDAAAALPGAAAVELIHNFTLIHDDIMDGDDTRRGRTALWRIWGATDALLAGDALHALAVRLLAGAPSPDPTAMVAELSDTVIELCRGQQHDCAFEHRTDVTVGEYLGMVAGKTGALLGSACAIGAMSAGADERTVAGFHAFGRDLGVAFQLVDDVLGIWGDPEVTGKPAGNDLARRKRSLPVIAAIEAGGPDAAELTRCYDSDEPLDSGAVARLTTMVENGGGRSAAVAQAEHYLAQAINAIPAEQVSDDLRALAHVATHRDL